MQDNEAMGSIMDYATYRLSRAKEAFEQLEQLRKNGTVSDEKAELNAYREEKYKQ